MSKIPKNRNKKLKVWILQTGEPLIIDDVNPRPMRGMNLASKLVERGHEVIFFSSKFNHQKKRQRKHKEKLIKFNSKLSFYLIDSPGYKNNISFKRLYDHIILGYNLKKTLYSKLDLPDIVFIGYPPIEVSYVMSEWLKKKKIPYILDIKDQWPDLIIEAFPKKIRLLIKFILYPYYYFAISTMKSANSLTSMSKSYLKWGQKFAKKIKIENDKILPLVPGRKNLDADKIKFANEWCELNFINKEKDFNIIFLGTMSQAFEFETVIKCAKEFQNSNVKFIFCGDGELKNSLIRKTNNLKNIFFSGWIEEEKISAIANRCSLAIAPYRNIKNFRDNIPNKIIDYLSFGLPILSSLTGEVKSLLDKEKIGFSYNEQSCTSLKQKIIKFIDDKETMKLYSKNAYKLYCTKYTYDIVYGDAVDLIEKIYKTSQL